MRIRWLGVGLVLVLLVCVLLLKSRLKPNALPATTNGSPAVLLVADLREANETNDNCALIIRAVREAAKRGVSTVELSSDSRSDLLRRYRILTVPTVLELDKSGKEMGRFEGEDGRTVHALETSLESLSRQK